MSGLMVALVLFAAFMHALWSTLIKSNGQAKANTTVFMACSAFLALFGLPFLPFPSLVSLPFLLASVVIQAGYMMLVGVIYQKGDVSQSYPVMRGVPPLLIALVSGPLLGEKLSLVGIFGIILISLGTLSLLIEAVKRVDRIDRSVVPLSLLTALFVAMATVFDGVGIRLSAAPISYILWIFVLIGAFRIVVEVYNKNSRIRFWCHLQQYWPLGLFAGLLSLGAYGFPLWAMTQLPVAFVAALRESSIFIVILLSCFVLQEKIGLLRSISSSLIVFGVIAVRLA